LQNVRYLDLDWLLKVEGAFGNVVCREDSFIALKLCKKVISLFVGKDQKEIQTDTVSDSFGYDFAFINNFLMSLENPSKLDALSLETN
jgi:hypothetical protein